MSINRKIYLIDENNLACLFEKHKNAMFNKKLLDVRMAYILFYVTPEKIANLLLSTFISVLYNRGVDQLLNRTELSINLGKNLFNVLLRNLYSEYCKSIKSNENFMTFCD